MAYNNNITTSIYGRRLGLQAVSTAKSGSTRGPTEYLVGPNSFRHGVTTSESTSVNLRSHGISRLPASSAGSSQVFTLDPPVPGVQKTIFNSTSATAFIKTGVNILSTVGSTQSVISLPAGGMMVTLTGLTTALWGIDSLSTASGIGISATT